MEHLKKRSGKALLIACLIVPWVLFSILLLLFTFRSRDPIDGLAWLVRAQIAAILILSVLLLVAERWLVVGASGGGLCDPLGRSSATHSGATCSPARSGRLRTTRVAARFSALRSHSCCGHS
jgi:hypothetical protein